MAKTMTKDEAMEAAKRGEKVTHKAFTDDEWFTFVSGKMELEDGTRCTEQEFWRWRAYDVWKDGYSIWNENK